MGVEEGVGIGGGVAGGGVGEAENAGDVGGGVEEEIGFAEAALLEEGANADLVVLDLDTEREVNPAEFKSKAKFTPWQGQKLRGFPLLTVVGGKVAFRRE